MTFEHQYNGLYYKFTPLDTVKGVYDLPGVWSISDQADGMGMVCDFNAGDYGLYECFEQFKETKKRFIAENKFNPQHN